MKRFCAIFLSLVVLGACSSDNEPADPVATTTSTTRITVTDTTVPEVTTSTTLPEGNLPSGSDEIVPIGDLARMSEWELKVVNVNLNGTQAVVDANQFNEPPADNQQFVLAEVTLKYRGETSSVAADLTYHAVGPTGILYDEFDAACGVIPTPLDQFKELGKGEEIQGHLCWAVNSEDVDGLMLVVSPVFNEKNLKAFLSLVPPAPEPEPVPENVESFPESDVAE